MRMQSLSGGLLLRYVDRQIVVVDKPPGMLSQPGRSVDGSVHTRLREAYPNAEGPMLVHRLDMDTSGLMVFALTREAHRKLHREFEQRQVQKRYTAILERRAPGLGGRVTLPLRLDPENRPRQIVCIRHGRPALTTWHIAHHSGRRVRLYPHTGRTHQLRVHAAAAAGLFAAIVGDPLYGRPATRMLLHADRLAFRHPVSGHWIHVESPAPF